MPYRDLLLAQCAFRRNLIRLTMTELATPPDAELSRRTARLEKLAQRFGDPFHLTQFGKTHSANEIKNKYAALQAGEKTTNSVKVAGRIMAIRNNGMFIVILDDTDRLQIFHDLKHLTSERAELLALLDLGDIIGVTGLVRRTPRGEITVDSAELVVLSKALVPPPEKFHGLKDTDARLSPQLFCLDQFHGLSSRTCSTNRRRPTRNA